MASILHIDSSPRGDRSHSRKLAGEFVSSWKESHPEDTVVYRDLRQHSIPHVTELWIAADFTPPEAHTPEMADEIELSDELVDEFLAADRCVFSVPMYNFNVPSNFKAYIDQIVRVNRTFKVEGSQFKGLVEGKKVLFVTARGAEYDADSPFAGWDFQQPFLQAIFRFMGVTDVRFIHANGLDLGDEGRDRSLQQARDRIRETIAAW